MTTSDWISQREFIHLIQRGLLMTCTPFSKQVNVVAQNIPNLFAKEYEDPRDAACLKALKLNKAFDQVVKYAIEYGIERIQAIGLTGSHVRVTRKNMPYLFECVEKACQTIDLPLMPDVYVVENPYINAFTTGSGHPILVFHNSILQRMNHEELMFVIGHELGHIKSEHVQYHMIGQYIKLLGDQFLESTVVGSIISSGLELAFYEWFRRSELTADHAGLLVCQDLKSAISALAKIGGYPVEFYNTLDPNDFLQQAQEFSDLDENLYNKVAKTVLLLGSSHPWTVLRARELMLWVQSGEYSRILHRCSKWIDQEINRLASLTNKAIEHHGHMKDEAEIAVAQHTFAKEVVKAAADESRNKKGFQLLMAKSQEGIKAIQAQISEGDSRRKQNIAENAMRSMETAGAQEKELRTLYRNVSESTIVEHTNMTIGALFRIDA